MSVEIDQEFIEKAASQADVTLASIPFIRLRDDLPEGLLEGKVSFQAAINAMRLAEVPPMLVFYPKGEKVSCSGVIFKLPPTEYFFYFRLIERQFEKDVYIKIPDKFDDHGDTRYRDDFLEFMEHYYGHTKQLKETLGKGLDHSFFQQRVTRINKHLRKHLGRRVSEPFELKVRGGRSSGCYGISLEEKDINMGFTVQPVQTSNGWSEPTHARA